MAKDNSKYNKTVIAMWENRNGNVLSMSIDAKGYDKLKEVFDGVEVGGRFILKRLSEESRGKFKDPEKAPHFFLEYMTKESVQEFTERNKRDQGGL